MREVYFMYSTSQVEEKKKVCKEIGRNFQCGEVSVGAVRKKFSDIISGTQLVGFRTRFPDAEIITHGDKSKMNYTMPQDQFFN